MFHYLGCIGHVFRALSWWRRKEAGAAFRSKEEKHLLIRIWFIHPGNKNCRKGERQEFWWTLENGLCELQQRKAESDTLSTDFAVSQHAETTGFESLSAKKNALKHPKNYRWYKTCRSHFISKAARNHQPTTNKPLTNLTGFQKSQTVTYFVHPMKESLRRHLSLVCVCVCVSRVLVPLSQRLLRQTPAPLWPWSGLNADIRMCPFQQTVESVMIRLVMFHMLRIL